jgi:hypothetical protein
MKTVRIYWLMMLLISLLFAGAADAQRQRNQVVKNDFKLGHPCPSTGENRGPCPGYVIDHIKPLACGGADDPSNMQWQTKAEAKAKDAWERRDCQAVPKPAEVGKECGGKRTCGQMANCAEAKHYFKDCGVRSLDRDHDGIPCESLCR